MTADLEVLALPMGDHTFPLDGDLYPGQTVVVVAYAVRHRGGVFLFDTGFRELGPGDDAELRAYYERSALRTRPRPDVLASAGIDAAEISAVANCHLHFDHAGQNARFPGIPIYAQPPELAVDTLDGPVLLAGQAVYSRGEWIGLPEAREGLSIAPDTEAYRRSIARLKALRPRRVLFGHDRHGWPD